MKYWYPTLSDEEIAEKSERIKAQKQADVNKSVEDMLDK